ncbi:D-hexose-6-phosphate mutarotase [Marinobacterium lutimaris]|uniref:Putative glucose-6-phosphate 1-epimerase n=1 Tax=Marinobacterium lutimaris TaxID=568106 RepID=A0A1H5TA67_9GAMM|nr:D-hexose-6-phosphate mutarotase [Marinobacterium lutimaris]SEF59644.1 dihydroxy-acid dehydratase/glucose-6-phosphate 1-epimerase [Marinobacterium lutimaris]
MFEPFTLPGRVRFYPGEGQLPECELTGPGGRTRISLQGAQVLSYEPEGQQDLFWLSSTSRYQPGKAIRGGIPVCWPWFGDHPDNPELPAHGFARTTLWEVRSSYADNEVTRLQLGLTDSPSSEQLWPWQFELILEIELGEQLVLSLTTTNTGAQSFIITEALHSYYAVGAADNLRIEGLKAHRYQDKLEDFAVKTQEQELEPQPPLDRVYDTDEPVTLIDPLLKRRIRIDKEASASTIVWNPGAEIAAGMADVGSGEETGFICIEAGNARERIIRLAPEESHCMKMSVGVEAIED